MAADAPAYPAYVSDQLAFYRRTSRTARVGYMVSETVALVAAAAVPVGRRHRRRALGAGPVRRDRGHHHRASAGLRVPSELDPALGRAGGIKARVAAYEAREEPAATRRLVHDVAGIALAETDRWRQLGEHAEPTPAQPKDE